MFSKINKKLVAMKAHYFLFNAGTGPVTPFLSTYARQLGFSSVVVGTMYTILPICGMLAKPISGAIADRYQCQKKIFMWAQLLTAVAFLSIYYSPELPIERKVFFDCDNSSAVFHTFNGSTNLDECLVNKLELGSDEIKCKLKCAIDSSSQSFDFYAYVATNLTRTFGSSLHLTTSRMLHSGSQAFTCPADGYSSVCSVDCEDYTLNELLVKPKNDDESVYGFYQFWVFLFLMIAGWLGQAIVVPVGDAICFEMLGDEPTKYGQQRLFGALGWGIFSAIAGVLVDAMSEGKSNKNFIAAFYMAAGFLVLDFLVSSRLEYTQPKSPKNMFRDMGRLLTDIKIIVFMIWCVGVGLCTGLIWQFLFWLIEDLAKAQGCGSTEWVKTLQGLVMAIQCLGGEMPFFFLSGWILNRIGHIHTMTLVLCAIGIRFILYSLISNPWWFLPIEFSNGLTFGLFFACMASYASIAAPSGTEATMQGMVGAIFEGVGVSLGSLIAGILYENYGGPVTFRLFGIGTLIFCVLHAAVQFLISLCKGNEKPSKDDENSNKRTL